MTFYTRNGYNYTEEQNLNKILSGRCVHCPDFFKNKGSKMSKYPDRNRILLSLNRSVIEQWNREHGVPPMLDDDGNPVPDEIFFMAVHRLILHITTISNEDKQRSIDWLTSHGWETGLDN